jgi:hypothetical protein
MSALRDFLLAPPASEPADRSVRVARARPAVRPARPSAPGLFHALRDLLVAPPAARDAPPADEALGARTVCPTAIAAAAPASVAVLCAAADARALGVAAATLLARRHRAPSALACVWTADDPGRADAGSRPPASRAARRLVAALGAHGLEAAACGRAALVALPADAGGAVAAAGRAAAVAGAAPVVLVLGGARAEAFDALLADADRVLVLGREGGDEALAPLAVAGLGPLGGRAVTATVPLGPATRTLAAAGLAVPARLRRALEDGR